MADTKLVFALPINGKTDFRIFNRLKLIRVDWKRQYQIYDNYQNLIILKFILCYHSVFDRKMYEIFPVYRDMHRYRSGWVILKLVVLFSQIWPSVEIG